MFFWLALNLPTHFVSILKGTQKPEENSTSFLTEIIVKNIKYHLQIALQGVRLTWMFKFKFEFKYLNI